MVPWYGVDHRLFFAFLSKGAAKGTIRLEGDLKIWKAM
jgi:hypothetical protein